MESAIESQPATEPNLSAIEFLEGALMHLPQVEHEIYHHFCPGIYIRQMNVMKDSVIIGHQHNHKHFNILFKGKMVVYCGGKMDTVEAPFMMISEAGTRKVAVAITDCVWLTIHPNPEDIQDPEILENTLVTKSKTYEDMKRKLADIHDNPKSLEQ